MTSAEGPLSTEVAPRRKQLSPPGVNRRALWADLSAVVHDHGQQGDYQVKHCRPPPLGLETDPGF
jgi:hypothetical protein